MNNDLVTRIEQAMAELGQALQESDAAEAERKHIVELLGGNRQRRLTASNCLNACRSAIDTFARTSMEGQPHDHR